MNKQMVIYNVGSECIHTLIKNGKCIYTGKTVKEYISKNGYIFIDIDQAIAKIDKIKTQKHIKPWQEISKKEWQEMLEILPPEKWQTVNGVEIFRMVERLTSNITAHYAKIGNRFFYANRKTSTKYCDLADQVIKCL